MLDLDESSSSIYTKELQKMNHNIYKKDRTMIYQNNKLNDPYTRFMVPQEFKNMQVDTSGELTGVGIQIGIDKARLCEYLLL